MRNTYFVTTQRAKREDVEVFCDKTRRDIGMFCNSCERIKMFEYIGEQETNDDPLQLYNCLSCKTTRSIRE